MAIPVVTGEGHSRAVTIRVVPRISVAPPQIFVERTNLLEGEQILVRWKPSPYFTRVRVTLSRDAAFTDIALTRTVSEPKGSIVGIIPEGTYYLRTQWEHSSLQLPGK